MKNIVLIGMPASGKSTVGVLLAKSLTYNFVDTDLLIQNRYGDSLCGLIEKRGESAFLKLENDLLAELSYTRTVIATGGSAVYGTDAMRHLRAIGTVVYLKLDLPEIERRIGNIRTRGVVMHNRASFADMYEERCALYAANADITVDCRALTTEGSMEAVLRALPQGAGL